MPVRVRPWAAAVLLAFVGPASAAIRYFPDPPGDDPAQNTVDYNLGTFSQVVVGLKPDSTRPDSQPFPNTIPAETILNVVDGGVISGTTFLYNGSTLNVSGGSVGDLYASYDPTTGGPYNDGGAKINISGGNVGVVNGYIGDIISLTHGTVGSLAILNLGEITMSGGRVTDLVQVVGSQGDANLSGGRVDGDVFAGNSSEGLSDNGGVITVSGATIGGGLYAQGSGTLTMTSGMAQNAYASENAEMTLTGGTITGAAGVMNSAALNADNVAIGGQVSVSDTAHFGGTGGSLGNGISVTGGASAGMTAKAITGQVFASGTSNVALINCSVTTAAGTAAVDAEQHSNVTLQGATTVTGDVYANGASTVSIEGSVVQGNVYAAGGTVTLLGGIINGHVTVLGGTFDYGGGVVTGGVGSPMLTTLFSPALTPADAADSLGITVAGGGRLNVYGTNLLATLVDPNYGHQYSEYALTGSLADGTTVNGTFLVENNSHSSYALLPPSALPEPGSAALLTAGLATAMLRRRRAARVPTCASVKGVPTPECVRHRFKYERDPPASKTLAATFLLIRNMLGSIGLKGRWLPTHQSSGQMRLGIR